MKFQTLLLSIIFIVSFKTINFAQTYKTTSGKVPLSFKMIIGDINGNTNKATSTLDLGKKSVSVNIPINSFTFNNPFVEEQFKKTYMEVDKYPETIFSGNIIQNINLNTILPQKVQVKGFLSMHGVKKARTISAVVTVLNGGKKIKVFSKFKVKASEHKVNVPASAFHNNDDSIMINLDAEYLKI